MSKSRRPTFSLEMVTPKPLSSAIGETVTLLKMTLLSLAHVGRASIGEFAESVIATTMVNLLSLEGKATVCGLCLLRVSMSINLATLNIYKLARLRYLVR